MARAFSVGEVAFVQACLPIILPREVPRIYNHSLPEISIREFHDSSADPAVRGFLHLPENANGAVDKAK